MRSTRSATETEHCADELDLVCQGNRDEAEFGVDPTLRPQMSFLSWLSGSGVHPDERAVR